MEIANFIFISLVSVKTHLMLGLFSKKLFNHFLYNPRNKRCCVKDKMYLLLRKVITYVYIFIWIWYIFGILKFICIPGDVFDF